MPAGTGAASTLGQLAERAGGCRACPLWREATQTVFGAGSPAAPLVLVGEQPGDREDMEGRPFVGPAGRVLDSALERAGIDPAGVYKTNAVKHFKYRMRGSRRIHQRPAASEVAACRPWLEAELSLLAPQALVLLGATAARALLGGAPSVARERGRPLPAPLAPFVMLTAHPAAALRERSSEAREAAIDALVADLRAAARALAM